MMLLFMFVAYCSVFYCPMNVPNCGVMWIFDHSNEWCSILCADKVSQIALACACLEPCKSIALLRGPVGPKGNWEKLSEFIASIIGNHYHNVTSNRQSCCYSHVAALVMLVPPQGPNGMHRLSGLLDSLSCRNSKKGSRTPVHTTAPFQSAYLVPQASTIKSSLPLTKTNHIVI